MMTTLAPRALDRYLDGRYRAANPTWHVEDSGWKAGHVCELLARHGVTPASVADVGCGAGEVLRLLHSRFSSARCVGFDVSADALSEARAREAHGLSFSTFTPALRDEFDLMLVLDVIEHVENYFDLLHWVQRQSRLQVLLIPLDLSALSVLRPHALLGARSSLGHIHYFTRATALAALEDCRLRVLDARFVQPPTRPSSVKHHLLRISRLAAAKMSADVASKVLGGSSLLVLTRSEK
jgi:SAM-dependent methyltransferase